jgi:hypothetical protein
MRPPHEQELRGVLRGEGQRPKVVRVEKTMSVALVCVDEFPPQ